MNRFIRYLIISILVSGALPAEAKVSLASSNAEILREFDATLNRKSYFEDLHIQRIDSIKSVYRTATTIPDRLEGLEAVARAYMGFQIDSTVHYFRQARDLAASAGLESKRIRYEALRCGILPLQGKTKEAFDIFLALDTAKIANDDLLPFNEAGCRLYYTIAGFYTDEEMNRSYAEIGAKYAHRVMSLIDESEPLHKYIAAHLYYFQGRSAMLVAYLNDMLDCTSRDDPYHAFAARTLGTHYLNVGSHDEAIYYLAIGAISEVRAGMLDGTALRRLGRALLDFGDTDRGYTCLTLALDNAARAGAKIRSMQTAEYAPLISKQVKSRYEANRIVIIGLCFLLFILGGVVACLFFKLCKSKKQLRITSKRIIESGTVRETYMCQFLNLCALYMEKVEEFNRVARRKISAGQIEDLYQVIKSGKLLDEQIHLFYEIFDDAFLNLYPTFIEDVNRLLRPDKQIPIPAERQLTTELRIFALMRLGIDDSTQIARLLGLSLNTIYTYRNKLRSKAIDRDVFESTLMNIDRA